MRELLTSNLNPRALFSWPVFLLSLGWSVATHFLDTVHNPEGFFVERLSVLLIAHLVMFAVGFLFVQLLLRLPPLAQSLLMLVAIGLMGSIRGLTKWSLMVYLGFDTVDLFTYRVLGPVVNLGIPLTLSSIAVHRIRGYSETRRLLLAENSRLLELKDLAKQQIRQNAELRLEQIKQAVFDSLSLATQLTPGQTVTSIRETIDKVVRPLSHQIDAEVGNWVPASQDASRIRLDWLEAFKGAFLPKFLWPKAVGLSVAATGTIFIVDLYPPLEAAFLLVVAGAVPWLVLWLVKSILLNASSRISDWLVRIFWIIGVYLAGFLTGSATLTATLSTDQPVALFFLAQYFVFGLATLFALASSTQDQARLANERLLETTTSLAWEVARISDEQRQLRRALAHALHGKLQAGLTSALIRMNSASTLETKEFEEIESAIRSELKALVDSISLSEGNNVQNVEGIMGSLAATWEGIATSEIELRDITEDELSGDPVLMNTLRELLSELTFNAIKHGGANKVLFSVSFATDNTVELTCTDNGERPSDSGRVGLGTKLLDECALSWKRETAEIGTKTTVVLPFAPVLDSLNP
jgi:two-component sensor histidine kinase